MEGPDGRSMGVPIYYVVLAGSRWLDPLELWGPLAPAETSSLALEPRHVVTRDRGYDTGLLQ
jgi:hypothetical protein